MADNNSPSGINAMQPDQENLTGAPASQLLAKSMDAFYRNLPRLLKKYYAKWVAYHGEEFVGAGRTQTELHQECLRRGFKEDEFVVLFANNHALADDEEIDLPLN